MMRLRPVLRASVAVAAGTASALLAITGCSRQDDGEVLAVVGDKTITMEEFVRHLDVSRARSSVPVDAEELLRELVEREVLAQNAVNAGLMDDPEVREQMRDVLIAKFKERQLTPQLEEVEVSEEEVEAAYEKEQTGLTRPEQVRLAILYASSAPGEKRDGDDEARLRLEAAAELARQQDLQSEKGEVKGFGPLAVNHSEDQESRYRGGEIGWVERGRFPGRLDKAAIETGFSLKTPGQISAVVTASNGCYVVKLLERRESSLLPLEQAAPALRSRLLAEKQEQAMTVFQDKLRHGLRVEMHPEKLAAVSSRAPKTPSPPPSLP